MFGGGIAGYHSDILSASIPEDTAGKEKLIEEIKNRAKGSVKAKNYPEAIELYSKGIEVDATSAILYANRSMCHMSMGASMEALIDADKSIALDPKYVKAYYRKGVALVANKNLALAKDTFAEGLALSPDDKELQQQYNKTIQVLASTTSTPSTTPATTTTSTASVKPSSSAPKKTTPIVKDDNDDEEEENAIIRGYKKTSDGRTTSYFHNEMDENTKALIGSIAPKKIESISATPESTASSTNGSAWNSAGTVETMNHSPWAIKRLEELLEFVEIDIPGGFSASVSKIKSVKGDAEIMIVRGKRKTVYDLSVELEWTFKGSTASSFTTCSGTMSITDISADLDMEISVQVDRSKSTVTNEANELVRTYIQSNKQGLQPAIVKSIMILVEEFKAK